MPASRRRPCRIVVCLVLPCRDSGAADVRRGKGRPASRARRFRGSRRRPLEPSESVAKIVAANGGHALQITTKAEAAYPSVLLVPRAGKWDLSGFEGVEMDVVNPQDFEVRVLLAINNPGSDGTHHCNVESATIKAHGKGKVCVPFGNWHGSTGHDLDLKNIVSLTVLLDRPGKAHTFLVDNIRAVRFDSRGLDSVARRSVLQATQGGHGPRRESGQRPGSAQRGRVGRDAQGRVFHEDQAGRFRLGADPRPLVEPCRPLPPPTRSTRNSSPASIGPSARP